MNLKPIPEEQHQSFFPKLKNSFDLILHPRFEFSDIYTRLIYFFIRDLNSLISIIKV